jgi:WD40 repeat protein
VSVEFSQDGKTLASASFDKTIKLWKLKGPPSDLEVTLLRTLQGHENWVWDVSFSPDGTRLASAGEDNTVRLWCPSTEPQRSNLEELLAIGRHWLRDYLKTKSNTSESDRHLCDGVGTQK